MEIDISKIWASPSTLHLRAVVWGREKKWMRIVPIHIPLDAIPSEVRGMILLSEDSDRETCRDQPLDFS